MRRRSLIATIPGLVSLFVGMMALTSRRWDLLGVPNPGVHFGDLRVALTASVCAAQDPSWSLETPPCLPGVEIYNYPSVWAKGLALVGAQPQWAPVIAMVFIVLFSASMVALTSLTLRHTATWWALVLMTVCAVTPPVLLAFERANIDLFVFTIVVIGIVLAAASRLRWAGAAIGVATALKLFPVGSATMLLVDRARSKGALLVYAVVSAIGLVLVARDLPLISSRTPQLDGASFGAALLPLLVRNRVLPDDSSGAFKIIGLGIFLLVLFGLALAAWWLARTRPRALSIVQDVADDPVASMMLLGGGGAWLVAYLVGPSFDYRLIFLIPVVAAFTRVGTRVAIGAAVGVAAQLVLSYSTYVGPREYLSDVMLLLVAPALAVFGCMVLMRGRSSSAR